jgi:serine/threonine protein kinase
MKAVGTGRWIAPEVLVGISDYGSSADDFSFGVLLSELDTHAIPYNDVRIRSSHIDGANMCDFALLEMIMTGEEMLG